MNELNVLEKSLKSGMEVEPFLSSYKALFPLIHEAGLTDDFRQGRKSCKRLRDEISVLAKFLEQCEQRYSEVCMPLDSGPVDAVLNFRDGRGESKVQITCGDAKSRNLRWEEHKSKVIGRGFYPCLNSDDYNQKKGEILNSKREAYSTEQAVEFVGKLLEEAVKSKEENSSKSDTLLVEMPLNILSEQHWAKPEIRDPLLGKVSRSNFTSIYLVDGMASSGIVLPLKEGVPV